MIIIANYTNRIGPNFYSNDRWVHPSILSSSRPLSSENYEESEALVTFTYKKYITFPGTYYAPPREVVATMLASEWELDLSLNFGSASLTETGKILKYSKVGDEGDTNPDDDVETINDKINTLYNPITFSDNNESGEDSIYFEILIGTIPDIEWDWTLKEWTVPIAMTISCGNNPEEGEGTSGYFGLGRKSGSAWGSELSGVTINCFQKQFHPFDNSDLPSDAFPSGSITLTPIKYLPLAVPPT